jgi:hypothetical protein
LDCSAAQSVALKEWRKLHNEELRDLYSSPSEITMTDLVEAGWADVDCIGLAQDTDKWGALVNAVMNHKMLGNYPVGTQLLASRAVLSSS